ncbi:M23 family metallopeptidase [Leucobacter sp. NPDC058333]|uniref:M23 family metallopeptidase n=1 Tax=Leucobacter sp. NPDC058333 TaxID=3346450 RepID=UPI0036561719
MTSSSRTSHSPDPSDGVGAPGVTAGYVQSPRLAHVPDADGVAPEASRPPRTARHRIARSAAVVSVSGLVLTLALPLVQQTGAAAPAAAQQRLFSEVSAEDLPSSLAEIDVVDTDEPSSIGYAFRARSVVNYPFAAPVALTDPFGYRTAPVAQFHDAQDFGAPAGTQVLAIADGVVTEAGEATDGCGFALTLEHEIDGKEVTSRYCHMQSGSHSLKVGDDVKMGDPAGRVGATGLAFGAHLHLALRVDDKPIDPMPFLAKYYRADRDEKTVTLRSTAPSAGNGTEVEAGATADDASATGPGPSTGTGN